MCRRRSHPIFRVHQSHHQHSRYRYSIQQWLPYVSSTNNIVQPESPSNYIEPISSTVSWTAYINKMVKGLFSIPSEKGRYLTQFYDKSPYTDRKIKKAMWKAKSRKYQGVFEVKSRVKTWQVRGIWSQQLEHQQVPKWGTEPGVRKGKHSLLACHTCRKCSMETSQFGESTQKRHQTLRLNN